VAWLGIAYLIAKITCLPLGASLVARFDTVRVLAAATVLVTLASFACGLAVDLEALVFWCAVQGMGGAVLLVAGQTPLLKIFPRDRQPSVQAVYATAVILAPASLAPGIEGWLTDALSWPAIFLLNALLGLAGLVAIARGFKEKRPRAHVMRLDWVGLGLLALAASGVVYVLQEGNRYDWFEEPHIRWLSVGGVAAFALFLAWEKRRQHCDPLIDFAVFRSQSFTFGFVVSFVAGFALSGSAFLISAFAFTVLEFAPTYAGLLLLPASISVALGLLLAAMLLQRPGFVPLRLVPLGILCFMTAMWWLSHATGQSGLPDLIPPLLLRGFGLGVLFNALTVITLTGLAGLQTAHGVVLFNIGRQMGGLIGIAFLQTYLDHQIALNRGVLAAYLAPGNPLLVERQAQIAERLAARGYDAGDATMAAMAIIAKSAQTQIAALSFNEAFLAVALIFLFAAPLMAAVKLIQARVAR
jgi:DHA2 family multidrug resistance protein